MSSLIKDEMSETLLELFNRTVSNNMPLSGESAYNFTLGESYEATFTDAKSKSPIIHMSLKPKPTIPSTADRFRISKVEFCDNRRLHRFELDTVDLSVTKAVVDFLSSCAKYTPNVSYDTLRPNHACFTSVYKNFEVTLSVSSIHFISK